MGRSVYDSQLHGAPSNAPQLHGFPDALQLRSFPDSDALQLRGLPDAPQLRGFPDAPHLHGFSNAPQLRGFPGPDAPQFHGFSNPPPPNRAPPPPPPPEMPTGDRSTLKAWGGYHDALEVFSHVKQNIHCGTIAKGVLWEVDYKAELLAGLNQFAAEHPGVTPPRKCRSQT
jgi:hypothetical protein